MKKRKRIEAEQFPLPFKTPERAKELREKALNIYASHLYRLCDAGKALELIHQATRIERELGIPPQVRREDWNKLKPVPKELFDYSQLPKPEIGAPPLRKQLPSQLTLF